MAPTVLAVTGGVGSGKSTFANMLAERGATVMSADKAAHAVLQERDVCEKLKERFGKEIVNSTGDINRATLAKKAFSDAGELRKLTEIVYPRIRKRLELMIENINKEGNSSLIVLEAPTLFESGCDSLADVVVTVEAPLDICENRCQENRHWPEGEATRREDFLIGSDKRRELADITVWNNDTLQFLEKEAERKHYLYAQS